MIDATHDAVFAGGVSKTWKSFRRRIQALDAVTLRIPRGAAFGLLGPNGAGKTTFVKILIGAVRPTSGTATVFGHCAGSGAARAAIGYVPESMLAPLHLTGAQLIEMQAALHGMDAVNARRRTGELLERVSMTEWRNVPLRKYSRGMRQRVCIAAAMVHGPMMLVLDEPTDGLDPAGRREVLALLRELNRDQGVTLLINSHLLHEVEDLCSEVAMLAHGRLVRSGSVRTMIGEAGYSAVLSSTPIELERVLEAQGIQIQRGAAGILRLHAATRDQLDWALDCARAAAARVESLTRETPDLESVYLSEVQS